MIKGSGAGSIPLTSGFRSGARRPKNMWIRIRNTAGKLAYTVVLRTVSYRRISPKIQDSLSAVTLGISVADPDPVLF
jgi:hypothetical protein